MADVQESYHRIGQTAHEAEMVGRKGLATEKDRELQKQARSRFQFEANNSDDDLEDELDENLD